jgi:hypothetical protein
MLGAGKDQQRIAVGRRRLHRGSRDCAARARTVFDADAQPEILGHDLRIKPRGDVGDAASSEPDHDSDRPVRKVVGTRHCKIDTRKRRREQSMSDDAPHGVPPLSKRTALDLNPAIINLPSFENCGRMVALAQSGLEL